MKLQKNKRGGSKKKCRTLCHGIGGGDRILSYNRGASSPFNGKDFNAVENSREAVTLIAAIAACAGKSAASDAKALRMSKVYANTAKVIVETADGEKAIIATADNIPGKKYYRKYTPGTIMHIIDK